MAIRVGMFTEIYPGKYYDQDIADAVYSVMKRITSSELGRKGSIYWDSLQIQIKNMDHVKTRVTIEVDIE